MSDNAIDDTPNVVWQDTHISKKQRAKHKQQNPCVIWFTGLSGSGKSTLANALELKLFELNYHTYLLDGDNVRHGLNADLGFDDKSRIENIRRIGEVSKLFVESGSIVLTAFISPFISDREQVRKLLQNDEFIEVFVDTPLNICEQRDPKGLYKKARLGEIKNFTGIDSPYENPINPEIHLINDKSDIDDNVDKVIVYLKKNGYINAR